MDLEGLGPYILLGALAAARIAPVLWMVPFLGGRTLPPEARIALAVLCAILVFPSLAPDAGAVPAATIAVVSLLFKEVLVGAAMGLVTALPFAALEMSGRLVDTAPPARSRGLPRGRRAPRVPAHARRELRGAAGPRVPPGLPRHGGRLRRGRGAHRRRGAGDGARSRRPGHRRRRMPLRAAAGLAAAALTVALILPSLRAHAADALAALRAVGIR
jgi:hypothetical protein